MYILRADSEAVVKNAKNMWNERKYCAQFSAIIFAARHLFLIRLLKNGDAETLALSRNISLRQDISKKKEGRGRGRMCIRIKSTIYPSWNPLSFLARGRSNQSRSQPTTDFDWIMMIGESINLDWGVEEYMEYSASRLYILLYRLFNPPYIYEMIERQSLSMIRREGIFHAIRLSADRLFFFLLTLTCWAPAVTSHLRWWCTGYSWGLDGVNDDDRLANENGIYGYLIVSTLCRARRRLRDVPHRVLAPII